MTEIGESIAIGLIQEMELQCPFDHEEPKPPKVDNDLVGVGTTLGDKMKADGLQGTCLYEKMKKDVVPSPQENPADAYNQSGKRPVHILVVDPSGKAGLHGYPVACAAHHLIPAQASLRDSQIMSFMCSKNQGSQVKKGRSKSTKKGVVWANVGYDVNGAENGKFLPGSYAINKAGTGDWGPNEDPDEDQPDNPPPFDPMSSLLTGKLAQIHPNNKKWLYVSQAVEVCKGQFHDSHPDYSEAVGGMLDKYAAWYQKLMEDTVSGSRDCDECKKRSQVYKDEGFPTPHQLIVLLNKTSNRLATFLTGAKWADPFFTSAWGAAYAKHRTAAFASLFGGGG